MFTKNIRWTIPLFVLALVLTACGQFSVGVEAPMEPTGQVEPTEPVITVTPEPQATLEPGTTPAKPDDSATSLPDLVYVGLDNNLWLLESGSGTPRQLTFDGNPIGNENSAVEYHFPRLSSDGVQLAFRRDVSVPVENGYDFSSALWVMDLKNGEQTLVQEGLVAGLAWKPQTHLLAYGTVVEMEYFLSRGEPNAALANGINAFDADSGEIVELVAPERGYTLANPQWSPDGRFLAFSEVEAMEGSGLFAYYNFDLKAYVAWEEAVGIASWSPNGGLLTYARQTYVATGEERLYVRQRDGLEEIIGPDYAGPAYATSPVFSPNGEQIAYLAYLEGPDTQAATIMVLNLASGEAVSHGQFEGAWDLTWTPDGSMLVFNAGPWEARHIVAIDLSNSSQTVLVEGGQPALAGR